MGVEFFNCSGCGAVEEIWSDCSLYIGCEECHRKFWECCQDEFLDENETCLYCEGKLIENEDLLDFLLEHFEISREQAENLYKYKRDS